MTFHAFVPSPNITKELGPNVFRKLCYVSKIYENLYEELNKDRLQIARLILSEFKQIN